MYMYSYDEHSESGIALARALGTKMIKHTDSKYRGDLDKVVLNWGCSDLPVQVRRSTIINPENSVAQAINKVKAFRILAKAGVRTVPFTEEKATATAWLAEGHRVFARTRVKGKDGEGLVECFINDQIPEARLYTKVIKQQKEYRVNLVDAREQPGNLGWGVAVQRRVKLDDFQGEVHPDIKTSGNGYGFKYVTQNIPDDVITQAKAALVALNLDFGGVDVLYGEDNQAYVLEVNTAPAFTPRAITTLLPYFRALFN